MQQHIKKGKDGKTHEASKGVSVMKKKDQAKIEVVIKCECASQQWPPQRKKNS